MVSGGQWHLDRIPEWIQKLAQTTDQLVHLESFVRKAFVNSKSLQSFDLENAFDMTWKCGMLRDLHRAGLHSRLLGFITNSNFLIIQTVSSASRLVPVGSLSARNGDAAGEYAISRTAHRENQQNNVKCLPPGVRCSLYAHDLLICCKSRNMRLIMHLLQRCKNNVQTWVEENGFWFSKPGMHISQQIMRLLDPELKLSGIPISDFRNCRKSPWTHLGRLLHRLCVAAKPCGFDW